MQKEEKSIGEKGVGRSKKERRIEEGTRRRK
jgi:hypothetical protein